MGYEQGHLIFRQAQITNVHSAVNVWKIFPLLLLNFTILVAGKM